MSQCITGYELPFSSFLGFYHGFTMVLPWFYHGFTMVLPWFYHGFTMVLPWFYHGISMPPPPFPVLAILLRDARLEAVSEHLLGAGKVVTKLGQLAQLVGAKENPPVSECKGAKSTKKSLGMVNDGSWWLMMVNDG